MKNPFVETLRASHDEQRELEKDFGGQYNAILGEILHIAMFTHFDVAYSCSRYGQYNCTPSKPAFEGLQRIIRYLASHPHLPLVYPRNKMTGDQEMKYEYDNGKCYKIRIPNCLHMFAGSDHARDLRTRKSMTCALALILGVLVHRKMEKQSCVAADSTDAEVRAFYTCTRINIYLRKINEFLQMHLDGPTKIFEDNQACMNILTANKVTTRVKHIAVPIAIIHEQIKMMKVIPEWVPTNLQLGDIGNKPLANTLFHRHK